MDRNHNLSDTIELNVDKARKAVGALFDETEPEEEAENPLVTGYKEPPDMQKVNDLFSQPIVEEEDIQDDIHMDKPLPEDEWQNVRRKPSAPPPKPAVKINASVPAASRAPVRPKKHLSLELEDEENTEATPIAPPPKARAMRSRYMFVEEDDEFTEFRQRYKTRDKAAESAAIFSGRAVSASAKTPHEDRSGTDVSSRPTRFPRQMQPPVSETESTYTDSGMPVLIRAVAIGLMVILLSMMAFLVYRITVVNGQLAVANEQIQSIAAMQQELARTQLELEAAREAISEVEEQNRLLLTAVDDTSLPNVQPDVEVENDTHLNQEADVTPPEPGEDRIHTVVAGDNLYRISVLFYGNGSYDNIQRIIAANNIANPNNIQTGTQLTIPY